MEYVLCIFLGGWAGIECFKWAIEITRQDREPLNAILCALCGVALWTFAGGCIYYLLGG